MNITEIHVDDFGAWSHLQLTDLSEGATVFYGPNEAGKTTLLNFVRTVLYGFSEKRCDRYLPPASGKMASGALDVNDVSGTFRIQRSAPAQYRGGPGTLRMNSPDGGHQGAELLTTLLSGVDETIFNNVFAVGLTQMQQLSTLSDTEAANQLYGLAAGVDRVSLHDVTQQLEKDRETIIPGESQGANGRIDDLLQQRERLRKELKTLKRDAGHWMSLRTEHQELVRKIKQKEHLQKRLDGRGNWPELSAKARKQWARCLELNQRLGKLGPVPDIPPHLADRVRDINQQVKARRAEWEKLRDQRKIVKSQAASLRGRDTLYKHAAEIHALDRQRPRIVELENIVAKSKSQLDDLEFELQAELEELGLQVGTTARQIPKISDQVIEALRVPAREARELRDRVEATKQFATKCRKEADELKQQIETAALRYGGKSVGSTLERGTELVNQLERRIQLDQHREDIVRRLDEMSDENKYWLQRGVLPWRGILTVCGIFSAGAMLLLTGLFSDWFNLPDANSWPMMVIGGTLSVVSLVIKGSFERNSLDRSSTVERQIELLFQQQEKARQETEEIDQALPSGLGNLDQRLLDARKELAELSRFMPLQHRHEELVHEADAADHQVTFSVRQLKDARLTWKASLRAVGLPDSLTPTQIGQMSGRVSGVTRLRERIDASKQEYQERKQELETLLDRIGQLQALAGFTTVSDGLGPQLDKLLAELEKHARSGRELEQLREQWEDFGQQQRRIATTADRLMLDRRRLLTGHGLSSVRDFKDTTERAQKATKMREQRDGLLQGIADLLGDEFSPKLLQKKLDQASDFLVEHLDELDKNRTDLGSDLGQLHERSGELKQRLEAHSQDRRQEKKALEIQLLDAKIGAASRAWLRSATVSAALERVRQTYETKRQPVALAEASRYLERLSEGRYTRIWTPMGRSVLCVDTAQGDTLPVEKLSRGTREQLFLSLRLALVGTYKRRGASMPLVLDDVFVNFDDQRAEATARVLFDVAQAGQQMLIFTCHKRIREIFRELEGDVRDLPVRGERLVPAQVAASEAKRAEIAPSTTPIAEDAIKLSQATPPSHPSEDLPVYDAESWDETVDLLALPVVPELRAQRKRDVPGLASVLDAIDEDYVWDDEIEVRQRAAGLRGKQAQFEPEWRDELLDPLPDLED